MVEPFITWVLPWRGVVVSRSGPSVAKPRDGDEGRYYVRRGIESLSRRLVDRCMLIPALLMDGRRLGSLCRDASKWPDSVQARRLFSVIESHLPPGVLPFPR